MAAPPRARGQSDGLVSARTIPAALSIARWWERARALRYARGGVGKVSIHLATRVKNTDPSIARVCERARSSLAPSEARGRLWRPRTTIFALPTRMGRHLTAHKPCGSPATDEVLAADASPDRDRASAPRAMRAPDLAAVRVLGVGVMRGRRRRGSRAVIAVVPACGDRRGAPPCPPPCLSRRLASRLVSSRLSPRLGSARLVSSRLVSSRLVSSRLVSSRLVSSDPPTPPPPSPPTQQRPRGALPGRDRRRRRLLGWRRFGRGSRAGLGDMPSSR